jgi:hypothetical protein
MNASVEVEVEVADGLPEPTELLEDLQRVLHVIPRVTTYRTADAATTVTIVTAGAVFLNVFLKPFWEGLLNEFGADAATKLREALSRHVEKADMGQGTPLEAVDLDTAVTFELPAESARFAEALAAMAQAAATSSRGTRLRWDPAAGVWRPVPQRPGD